MLTSKANKTVSQYIWEKNKKMEYIIIKGTFHPPQSAARQPSPSPGPQKAFCQYNILYVGSFLLNLERN